MHPVTAFARASTPATLVQHIFSPEHADVGRVWCASCSRRSCVVVIFCHN